MMEALKKYSEDEMLWREINMELGADENIDKMIKRMQQKKVGKRPKNRDEFDPSAYVGDKEVQNPRCTGKPFSCPFLKSSSRDPS